MSNNVTVKKPIVAQFCTALAWLVLIPGAIMFASGIFDSFRGHPAATGETMSGSALCFGAILLFVAARAIALLAEIAHNTRK